MKAKIIGLGMLMVASAIWAEKQKGTLTLELIWEKEFEEGIRNVCIEPTSVGTGTRALAEAHFPIRAVETRKGIKFLNEKGEIVSEIKPEKDTMWLYTSENGRYVGIQSIKSKEDYKRYRETGETTFDLRDNRGNTIYKIDGVPECVEISPRGSVVATRPAFPGHISDYYRGLSFYSPSGSLTKKIDIKTDGVCAFSKDGSLYAAFSLKKKRDDSFKAKAGSLVLFTTEGEELWRYNMDNMEVYNIIISDDGRYIAVASNDFPLFYGEGTEFTKGSSFLHILNREGDLLGTYSVGFEECGLLGDDEALAFSPEGDYLAVSDYHNIYFFKTKTGKMLWRYQLEIATLIPNVVSVSSGGEYIVGGIGPRVSHKGIGDVYVYIFNKLGQVIAKKDAWDLTRPSAFFERVEITSDRKYLLMTTDDKILFFNLK